MKLRLLPLLICSAAASFPALLQAGVPDLTAAMEAAAPGRKLRGTVMAVETVNGATTFPAWHYKNEPDATDFWPASTIKIYAAVAALEKLHALNLRATNRW